MSARECTRAVANVFILSARRDKTEVFFQRLLSLSASLEDENKYIHKGDTWLRASGGLLLIDMKEYTYDACVESRRDTRRFFPSCAPLEPAVSRWTPRQAYLSHLYRYLISICDLISCWLLSTRECTVSKSAYTNITHVNMAIVLLLLAIHLVFLDTVNCECNIVNLNICEQKFRTMYII